MTAGSGPGAACTACSAPFDTRSRAHRLTCFARCRSRLFRIRRRKTVWDGAWLGARRDAIGARSISTARTTPVKGTGAGLFQAT